jgi:uncharacterized protein (TIGR04255 family)
MSETVFKQPPLVEIVAEFRWDIPGLAAVPEPFIGIPMPVPDAGPFETLYVNFASKAAVKGFGLVERIVPSGFPAMAHQVVFRYTNPSEPKDGKVLFQLGPGVFTVNIVPPYKSWESFLPYIDLGLDLLLGAREENPESPFSSIQLRYIDAFSDVLRQGKPTARFLAEDLGIGIKLPDSITRFCTDADGVRPSLTMAVPIESGVFEITVSEGWVRNTKSVVMQSAIVMKGPTQAEKGPVLAVLDKAHRISYESFVGMTKSIHHLMQPEKAG